MNEEQTAPEAEPAPAPEAQQEAQVATDSKTIADDLAEVWDSAQREEAPERIRDEKGRFASQEATDGVQNEIEGESPQVTVEDAESETQETQEAISVPTSWTAEAAETWESLPPETQKYIADRESEAAKKISEQGNEIKALERFRNLEQFENAFASRNLTIEQGIATLINAQNALDTNPRAAIEQLAQYYGIDLSGDAPEVNPEVETLRQQVAQLSQQLTAQSNTEDFHRAQAAQKQIDAFRETHEHFDALEEMIGHEVEIINRTDPGMDMLQKLEKAYENAMWKSPEVREAKAKAEAEAKAKAEKEEAQKRIEAAKKAKNMVRKSEEAQSETPRTMAQDLRDVADRIYG